MISEKFSLEGKTALVVGTGRSWHGDLALYLAEAGASVEVVGGDTEQMKKAEEKLGSVADQVNCIIMDLTDQAQIEKTVSGVIKQRGKIDILVNNFDSFLGKPFLEMTTEEWNRVFHLNLMSVFQWTQAVGRDMVRRKQGRIINISSILSERGLPESTAYCAASGGISQLTKSLALEWGRYNISVNAIGVGWVGQNDVKDFKKEEKLQRYITLKRFCQPEDIGAILIYLASSSSNYATGQTYFVSGGVMSHG